MAWAISFDGVNDRMTFDEIVLSGDFSITFNAIRFDNLSSNHFIIGHSSITSNWVGKFGTDFTARIGGVNASLPTPPSVGVDYDITISRVGSTVTISEPILGSGTVSSSGNVTLNQLGRFQARDDWLFSGRFNSVVVVNSAANRDWDATSSSHGSGTPILTDTIGGNNATGINMPTDGSAWVDLGGGGFQAAWAKNANVLLNWYN